MKWRIMWNLVKYVKAIGSSHICLTVLIIIFRRSKNRSSESWKYHHFWVCSTCLIMRMFKSLWAFCRQAEALCFLVKSWSNILGPTLYQTWINRDGMEICVIRNMFVYYDKLFQVMGNFRKHIVSILLPDEGILIEVRGLQ